LVDLLISALTADNLIPSKGGRFGNPFFGANLEVLGFIYTISLS
jgi:hypothetical protein